MSLWHASLLLLLRVIPFTLMCSHAQFINSGQKQHECFICTQNLELSRSTESLRESVHLLAEELKYKGNTRESLCLDLSL